MNLLAVRNLGKSYRSYSSEWNRVFGWFGLRIKPTKEHWVLRNVNFEVQQGESIGIIGRNGAGKSTLLKIIAKTLEPSEGSVETNGSVAAILELGMGFDRELSGRANVIHAAGLMGIDFREHSTLVPEVMAFAELGEYFDQPVRTYSSGMSARLAFSLATAYRPDLLIVDEALSVGDDAFRRKCFARIEEYLAQGTSLLLVSHSAEQIRRICTRAIYLDKHKVVADGTPKDVCALYEKDTFSGFIEHRNGILAGGHASRLQDAEPTGRKKNDLIAEIVEVILQNDLGEEINMLPTELTMWVHIKFKQYEVISNPAISLGIKTPDGVRVYAAVFKNLHLQSESHPSSIRNAVHMKANLLPGTYFITVGLFERSGEALQLIHQLVDEVMFRVYRGDHDLSRNEIGFAALDARLQEQQRGLVND